MTVDVLLCDGFGGGDLQTLEVGGEMKSANLRVRGDAVAFVSHKYHCVTPVLSGERKVCVCEIWAGEERVCPHRCKRRHSACVFRREGGLEAQIVASLVRD